MLRRAIDRPDVTLAVSLCVLGVPLALYLQAVIGDHVYTAVAIVMCLSCLAYLVWRERATVSTEAGGQAAPRTYVLLNIIFVALLICGVVILRLRPDPYTRPLGYFAVTAAMTVVLAVEVLFLPSRRSATYISLLKIVVVGISVAWMPMLVSPSVVGVDPWYHQMFASRIVEAGQIATGKTYSWLPGMHLLSGATSLITGLDYRMATMCSVVLFQVMGTVLFVFLLGRFIHSTKAGLLSALIIGVATWHIWFAYWTIPNGMAVVFIPVIIYVLLKLRQEKPRLSIALSVLLMATLTVTHPIGAVMLAVVLLVFWLTFEVDRRVRRQAGSGGKVFILVGIAFAGGSLGFWALVSGHFVILTTLADRVVAELVAAFIPGRIAPGVEPSQLAVAVAEYGGGIPFVERLLSQLGLFLFYGLALIGVLAVLSQRLRNSYGIAVLGAGLIVMVVAFLGSATGYFALARWHYLAQILLAIPAGIALLRGGSLSARRYVNVCTVGITAFVLSFLMILSLSASPDNRTLSPDTGVRYAFTMSELMAIDTISDKYDGRIGTDWYVYHLRFVPVWDASFTNIGEQLYVRDFRQLDDTLILLREEIIERPFKIGTEGIYRLEYDPRQTLPGQGFSKVYECGSISGFLIA